MKKDKEQNGTDDLAKQIMKRGQDRAANFDNLMDRLLEKYGNDDDDVAFTLNNKGKKKKGATGSAKGSKEKEKKETPIKTGRVTKNRK
jgi:hypothetical protein